MDNLFYYYFRSQFIDKHKQKRTSLHISVLAQQPINCFYVISNLCDVT